MSERITIPAACLEVLGGLREDDPPVLVVTGQGTCQKLLPYHPLLPDFGALPFLACERILVRQSAPALLAVLGRLPHVEMVIEVNVENLAHWVVEEAIAAHGSDPGWSVEVTP